MTQPHKTEGVSSRHGTTQPPEKAGAPSETKPRDPPQRPNTGRGKTDEGGGGGDENPSLTRLTQDQAPDGGDGAATRGAMVMKTREVAAMTETGAKGTGHPAAHPTGAAPAAAAGGLVGGDRTIQGGGESNDARYSPAQTSVAVQAALEETQVRARPAPASSKNQQMAGGEDTPRSADATGRTADEAMAERPPPDRP